LLLRRLGKLHEPEEDSLAVVQVLGVPRTGERVGNLLEFSLSGFAVLAGRAGGNVPENDYIVGPRVLLDQIFEGVGSKVDYALLSFKFFHLFQFLLADLVCFGVCLGASGGSEG